VKKILTSTIILTLIFSASLSFPFEATSQNATTKQSPEKINLESAVNSSNLMARFNAYANNSTSTINELATKGERSGKIKILIVPGHDNEYPGAIVGDTREADLNLKISEYLKSFLAQETAIEVYTTRDPQFIKQDSENPQDKNGYIPDFQKYLDEKIFEVLDYRTLYKEETEKLASKNKNKKVKIIEHNPAPGEMLYRLYAVNKFIEDNEIDIAIHIHLNDYAGRNISEGKYKGFSLFVPDNSLRNGKVSQELAKYIAKTLDDNFKYSNNPLEKKKIILGHELIANGANNTIQAASVLIEYGYIYETKFQDEEILQKAAEQTYLGIKNYLTKK
jgi:N-acetylmuramoyl-L-alanine amidase